MSSVRPIRNDADYDAALARVDYLMASPPTTVPTVCTK